MRKTKNNYFSGENSQTEKYILMSRLEAEKNVVLYFHRQQSGGNTAVPETDIQKLDSGEYDTDLVNGLRLVPGHQHPGRSRDSLWLIFLLRKLSTVGSLSTQIFSLLSIFPLPLMPT